MNEKDAKAVSDAIALVTQQLPILGAAYQTLRIIWGAANPEMTEQDYIDRLRKESVEGGDFTGGWLRSHGYMQDAAGNWSKA